MSSDQGKKTRGRQKIEMKKIENKDDMLSTFSKRRSGIYKKACELVTLTGAEVAFVVFSPAGKIFSFAHPSMESIANRLLGNEPIMNPNGALNHPLVEAHRQLRIEELNQRYHEMLQQLDVMMEKRKQLERKMRGKKKKEWWETPIEDLNVQEMIKIESTFENIRIDLVNKLKKRIDSNTI